MGFVLLGMGQNGFSAKWEEWVESRDAPSGSLEKLEKIMESNKGKGNVLV